MSLLHRMKTVNRPHIHSLTYIPTLRKSAVIGSKESKNELTRPLVGFVDPDVVFHEFCRVNHECNVI